MISVNDRECIRRAYFVEHKSFREIAKELGHSRKKVQKVLKAGRGKPVCAPRTASSPDFSVI